MRATCVCWSPMVMTKGDGLFKRIVVGTDGSDTATEAVRQAIELAKMSGAKLGLVAAFEPVPRVACVRRRASCRETSSTGPARGRTST